jgi:DNA polymerase-1
MAKRVDFGILYGRSAKALAEGPEMDYLTDVLAGERWTLEQAELYVRRFLEGYPRLRDWMQETADGAIRDQFVDTPLGRRRRFPYITRAIVGHTRRQAVNTPIQSVASDLCLEALIRVNARAPEFGGHVLFAVHDSVALEIPKERLVDAIPILRYEFSENLSIDPTGIPFTCDIEVGPNWHETKKVGPDDPMLAWKGARPR